MSANRIKLGDMVWFDSFYHKKNKESIHPSEYSIVAVVVKQYSEKEKKEMFHENYPEWKAQNLYEVMMNGGVYPAPERTLIEMYRQGEPI